MLVGGGCDWLVCIAGLVVAVHADELPVPASDAGIELAAALLE